MVLLRKSLILIQKKKKKKKTTRHHLDEPYLHWAPEIGRRVGFNYTYSVLWPLEDHFAFYISIWNDCRWSQLVLSRQMESLSYLACMALHFILYIFHSSSYIKSCTPPYHPIVRGKKSVCARAYVIHNALEFSEDDSEFRESVCDIFTKMQNVNRATFTPQSTRTSQETNKQNTRRDEEKHEME